MLQNDAHPERVPECFGCIQILPATSNTQNSPHTPVLLFGTCVTLRQATYCSFDLFGRNTGRPWFIP
jgi:hypothetical protein